MKKGVTVLKFMLLVFLFSCSPSPKEEMESRRIADSIRVADSLAITQAKQLPAIQEPVNRDAAYYRSKGFQVFPQYGLAVKCPVLLTDASNKSKAHFDFHYGGIENNEAFYEIIVINLPLGYKDLVIEERNKFEQQFLSDKFSGRTVLTQMGGKEINAKVMEYEHQQGHGRGIAFILNGRTFAFNVIAKERITERFNALTNNIIFYVDSTNKVTLNSSITNTHEGKETTEKEKKKKTIISSTKLINTPNINADAFLGSQTNKASTITKASPKKSNPIQCVNCSNFQIEFRNYQWDNSWDGLGNDVSLSSFNVINKSNSVINEIRAKWIVYDPDGVPVNSGEDHLNLALESIEPNSGKLCYGFASAHKKRNQTMKITIISIK